MGGDWYLWGTLNRNNAESPAFGLHWPPDVESDTSALRGGVNTTAVFGFLEEAVPGF
jgi:hypothetical protein